MTQREIKFRAWDKDRKCFINRVEFGSMIFPIDGGNKTIKLNHSDHVELMQYTGLKDKNGKEIYEGDIVKAQDGTWEIQIRDLEDGVVLINESWQEGSMEFAENIYALNETEIIGNIYENPELLK